MRAAAEIINALLEKRGVPLERREAFLHPEFKYLASAETLPGVAEAVSVILPFVAAKKKIVVFGDYDCDGICGAAILVKALRQLGGVAEVILPEREAEGYGLTPPAIARMFREYPDIALLVTVDNGVTATDAIADVKKRGVAVVVTDHHLPAETLPQPDAMVESQLDGWPAECKELCGAGIAFFLVLALVAEAKARGILAADAKPMSGPFVVLAGLATVTDAMSLLDQNNRILVAQSLKYFKQYAPLGLRELFRLSLGDSPMRAVTARDYGFLLGPRVNAPGRVARAMESFDLLMEEDADLATLRAEEVDKRNNERKEAVSRIMEDAMRQMESKQNPRAIVVQGDDWNLGSAGIVAARLAESFHVPAAVIAGLNGSARAPGGYNVHDALQYAQRSLDRFGGHAAAGGLSVKEGELSNFRKLFMKGCALQRETNAEAIEKAKHPDPDVWIRPSEITMMLVNQLPTLEPFGAGNPEPVFGLQYAKFSDVKPLGSDGKHLSLRFISRYLPRAVWWFHGADVEKIRSHGTGHYDVLFYPCISTWGSDVPHLELSIVDIRETKGPPAS